MDWNDFRAAGHFLVDWIADYRTSIEQRPVLSQVPPESIRAQLPAHPPQQPESFGQMMADVDRVLMPGITHWQSPNFFAYFPSNSSPAAVLGELLSAAVLKMGVPRGIVFSPVKGLYLADDLSLNYLVTATHQGGG